MIFFSKFIKFILNATNYKIINIKSDNGTEYINANISNFLNSHGINIRSFYP